MSGKPFRPEQARLVADAFERHGVRYLFIGKGGAILLGYPGATQDVDVYPEKSPGNGHAIVGALREIGFRLSATDERDIVSGRDFVQIGDGPFDIDLVFAPDGVEDFAATAARAERIGNLHVMSIADIIASKRAAGRERDLADLDLLEAFRAVYEAAKPGKPLKP